jgi:hypothetical protein
VFGCPAGSTEPTAPRNGKPAQGVRQQARELRAMH